MNKITKKTAFGITGAAAATLLVGGLAAPAMAETAGSTLEPTTETSSEWTQTQLDALGDVGLDGGDVSNESPVVLAPEVGVGGVGVGDIGSGNAIGSGNELNAPIASGNETAIGNNNANDNANGTDIGANVSDIVDNSTGVTSDVSDIVDSVDVDGMIDDVTSGLDLGGILGE